MGTSWFPQLVLLMFSSSPENTLDAFSKHISGNPFAQQGLHLCPKVSTDTYYHGICTFVNIYI